MEPGRAEKSLQVKQAVGSQGLKAPGSRGSFHVLFLVVAILAAAGFLLFWKLGDASFRNGDEAMYAQCAREMVASGEYLTVSLQGEPFLEKPPFKMWMIMLGYRLFGINELGARFSSALFALGAVALTLLLGRLIHGTATGLIAGVILVSSPQFIHEHVGRTAEMEPETVFLYVSSMSCLWLAQRSDRWFYVLGGTLGIMALTKGPVILPAFAITALFLIMRKPRMPITPRVVVLAVLIFLAVALPWHIHQLVVHGNLFRRVYLDLQILSRFTGDVPGEAIRTVIGIKKGFWFGFYPSVIFHSMFPWSLLILPALAYQIRDVLSRPSNAERLLLLWILVFAVTVTSSRGKLPWYAVPMLPALALSVAHFCTRLYRSRPGWLLPGILIGALVLSVLFLPAQEYDPYSRVAVAWPRNEANVIALWDSPGFSLLTILPGIVTLTLVIAVVLILPLVVRPCASIGRGRALWIALVGSFLFSGLYQAALPLRHAGHRHEMARCRDAVLARGIHPEHVVLLGELTARTMYRATARFYLYDLTSRYNEELVIRKAIRGTPADSVFHRSKTLVLAIHVFREKLSALGLGEPLWSGDRLDAFYVDDH